MFDHNGGAVLTLGEVDDQREVLRELVGRLEPGAVPLPEAGPMWQVFDAIERLAAGAKTLLAVRVDQSGVARRSGDKDTADYLARRAGISSTAARQTLETSKRLARLPHTRQAVRRGDLSRQQADEIADAADKNPAAEDRLLETAKRASLGELRHECARRRAEADPDPDATRRRLHRGRWLRRWTDAEGAWNLHARGTPDDGSRFNAVFDRIRDELFGQARSEGRREPAEAYSFDALIALALRHGTRRSGTTTFDHAETPADASPARQAPPPDAGDPRAATTPPPDAGQPTALPPAPEPEATRGRPADPTHLALLRVDWEALVRGGIRGGEVCEIAGVGPVSVAAARALLGESVLKLVVTRGTDVINVTNLGRGPTAAQKVALLWSSPECTVLGCTRRLGIEHDHREPWTTVHETATGNLDRYCGHHHDLKTRHGWALVPGTGKRPMVAPDDPRHPGNQSHDRSPPEPGSDCRVPPAPRPDRVVA